MSENLSREELQELRTGVAHRFAQYGVDTKTAEAVFDAYLAQQGQATKQATAPAVLEELQAGLCDRFAQLGLDAKTAKAVMDLYHAKSAKSCGKSHNKSKKPAKTTKKASKAQKLAAYIHATIKQ